MIDLKNGSHWWTTAVDPGSWNGVNRLQSLDLSRNLLSHFDPSVCAFLPQLEELGLSFNRIAWVWREVPAACQNLRRLDLSHNALHAEILQNPRPDTFEAYHQLHVLDLSFNSNRSVPFLGHSINLKIVKLNENGPNPTGAPLTHLNLSRIVMTLIHLSWSSPRLSLSDPMMNWVRKGSPGCR